MVRWINLRHVTGGAETRSTDTREPPNYPDPLCNGKQFVFVHGFNLDESGARGWNAEVFKRLYQSGSRAMFTAVTWYGDETPGILPPGAYYHADVINAFQTASALASTVAALPGQKYLAAHSLGNMVASSAIVDHGLNPVRYFMIDAAVAMEAYIPTYQYPAEIAESPWPTYTSRLWASDWYKLFDSTDGRYHVSWRDRFGDQRFSFWRRGRSSAGEETAGERPRGACNGEAARRCVWVWTGDRSERSLKRCRTSVSCYEKGAKRVGHDRRAQYDWGRRLRVLGCWSVGADLQTAHHEIQHGFPGGKAVVT